MPDPKSLSSQVLVIIVVLLTAGAGFLFFYWLPKRRAAERSADEKIVRTLLWSLGSAEADFRANDRDSNGVLDFWTGDVAELFKGAGRRDIAQADVNPIHPLVPTPVPFHGYYFAALHSDDSETPPEAYRQETDKKSGKVHHLSKYGFVAFPADPASGRRIYIVNENHTVFHRVGEAPPPKNWPTDAEIVNFWLKID